KPLMPTFTITTFLLKIIWISKTYLKADLKIRRRSLLPSHPGGSPAGHNPKDHRPGQITRPDTTRRIASPDKSPAQTQPGGSPARTDYQPGHNHADRQPV